MSASSKKNGNSKLTERQIAEQKEAQKLKIYTCAFVVVLVAIVLVAIVAGVTSTIASSGVHEKNTVAAKVGDYEISNAELSYYYVDAINAYANNYGSYLSLFGLDSSKPLNEQMYDETQTWADYFVNSAAESAKSVYAVSETAKAEGFTLDDDAKALIDNRASTLDAYAVMSGAANADAYVKAMYGRGTSKASYLAYYERNLLASEYQSHHEAALEYTDAQIREADSQDPAKYTSYSYNSYNMPVTKFQTGGTVDEETNVTTYSDEEKAAAAVAAKEAAESLVEAAPASVEEFDAAIAALSINEGTTAASTAYTNNPYASINSNLTEWVTDTSRKAGDITSIPVTTTSIDEDGNETENVTTYYVVYFNGVNTNESNMVNVRHILLSFDGETNEDGTYTDEAKAATKASAEELLSQWQAGEATEDSFAALANEKSTDSGSNTNGGLYENVYPGQMVTNFNDWCFDETRKAGDTGIVETNYGYHIMYFVSTSETTYRDYMITNDLRNADMESWYNGMVEAVELVMGDTSYMRKDITLG